MEGTCGAISHASDTHLHRIDNMQRSFSRELGLSEETAFLEHNFAPTQLRRHIAVLGIIFKSRIGIAHPELMKLFPAVPVLDYHTHHVLRKAPVHNWQVHDFCGGGNTSVKMCHSILGIVRIYNRLPAPVFHTESVSGFQHNLTNIARDQCHAANAQWLCCFSNRLFR